MAKTSVKTKILNIGKMFKQAKKQMKADSGDAVPVGEGSYAMQLVKADIAEMKGATKLITTWCVLDEGAEQHKLCKQFDEISAERWHWILKLLTQLGVDVDEAGLGEESATTEDLMAILNEKIEEQAIVRVAVTENGAYHNMRVKGVHPEAEEFSAVDAEDAVKGKLDAGDDEESDDDSDEEEETDEAKDTDEDADDEVDEEEDADDEEEEDDEPKAKKGKGADKKDSKKSASAIKPGDSVSWEDEDGDQVEGEVVSITGDDARVRKEGEKKAQMRPLDALTKSAPKAKDDDEEEETDEEEGDEDGVEVDVGSKVIVTIKGKDKHGVVKKVLDDGASFKVKVGNEVLTVDAEQLSVEMEG